MSREESEVGDSFDNTLEITLDTIKKRAIKGVVVLTGRTFLLQLLALVATGFLTVLLEPSDFGVFWIVSAVVNFLAYFSDVGLAAALIQSKEKITDKDLKTTFAVQQSIVITLLVGLYVATPWLRDYYQLSHEGVYLFYALGISLLLSSLKTIPSVLLERELDFSKLVIPQVLENVAYNVVAVFFAWQGLGVMAFTYAVLIRGIVGIVSMYYLKTWVPGVAFSKNSMKKLLKFGVPYQVNTLLATVKDDGLTAYLGGVLGSTGLGYLGWAQKWAKTPLRLFMDNVLKVMFPAFARMQDDKDHLERSVTRSIFFVCFLTFPTLVGFVLLAPMLVDIIPRYEKWRPALVPLYIIGIDTLFAASTTQLTNLLNAIGKIKITFKLMVMWTVLAWLFIPFLSVRYGYVGAAIGYALVSSSSVIAIYIVRKYVKFSLTEGVFKPLLATGVMGVVVFLLRDLFPSSIVSVTILGGVGVITYFAISYKLVGVSLLEDVKKAKHNLIKR